MTDERMGERLWPALRRLPPGSGVVVRHRATPPAARARLLRRVRRIARARHLVLVVAGGAQGAGTHGSGRPASLRSWPAHDRLQAIEGCRRGATILFVSPVFATASHPGARGIGPMRAARIAAGLPVRVIALGGMTRSRWQRIRGLGFDGYAGIDVWLD